MKLPNGDKALVPTAKIEGYALNFKHEKGKHKARVFKAALDITIENAAVLHAALHSAARNSDAQFEETTAFDDKYIIDFEMTTEKGSATVRSAWILDKGSDTPRLTSTFIKEMKKERP
ncbi:MAG: hypothetical protein IAF08_05445 [Rhizobacter sp.]|nr:hypothetical protein [Chlorobiales bacterium]